MNTRGKDLTVSYPKLSYSIIQLSHTYFTCVPYYREDTHPLKKSMFAFLQTTGRDGRHWYDRTLLSSTRQSLYHKKRVGWFVNPVLLSCSGGKDLMRWRGGYLPLSENSKHPFRLVMRALGGKRIEKHQILLRLKLHSDVVTYQQNSYVTSMRKPAHAWTNLRWTSAHCIGGLLHGYEEVKGFLPALLMKRWSSVQNGHGPRINVFLSCCDPGTPVSVLSNGVKIILVHDPDLKRRR